MSEFSKWIIVYDNHELPEGDYERVTILGQYPTREAAFEALETRFPEMVSTSMLSKDIRGSIGKVSQTEVGIVDTFGEWVIVPLR